MTKDLEAVTSEDIIKEEDEQGDWTGPDTGEDEEKQDGGKVEMAGKDTLVAGSCEGETQEEGDEATPVMTDVNLGKKDEKEEEGKQEETRMDGSEQSGAE